MAQKKILNVHPGEILLEEFLKPMDITAYRLAKETGIPESKISDIIKGKRNITASVSMSNNKIKKRLQQRFNYFPNLTPSNSTSALSHL